MKRFKYALAVVSLASGCSHAQSLISASNPYAKIVSYQPCYYQGVSDNGPTYYGPAFILKIQPKKRLSYVKVNGTFVYKGEAMEKGFSSESELEKGITYKFVVWPFGGFATIDSSRKITVSPTIVMSDYNGNQSEYRLTSINKFPETICKV